MTRVARLAELLEQPLLVTAPANVRWLTGFSSSNAAVLVEPAGEATVFADFRYAEAGAALTGVAFVCTGRNLLADLAERLAGRTVAFETEHVTHAGWETLRAGPELVAAIGLVEGLRAVKDADEVDAIRRAAVLSDRVFGELAGERCTGRTERELAWWVERRFRELGADALSFPVIVASGANGARPHGAPEQAEIPPGTLVTVDAGCVVDGYCSDCTRTFATGELPDELARAYELCLQAQLDGLAAVRPGARLRDVDAASRVAIAAAGLAERYGHGLGHGVGLEVHEAPGLRPTAPEDARLAPGNVVTIEPGIYLPGVGGVRIEDLVLVTDDGYERLTKVTKELVTVA